MHIFRTVLFFMKAVGEMDGWSRAPYSELQHARDTADFTLCQALAWVCVCV